jgi:tRNA(fMet)-specific endonuclease VapC
MIVADSDVLIDFLRGRGFAKRVAIELETRDFATTAINAFELRSGGKQERQERRIDDLLAAMTILPVGSREAQEAARLRIALEAKGEGIGMADYLIAGTCIVRDRMLLTRNRAHFERLVPHGLKLSGDLGQGE